MAEEIGFHSHDNCGIAMKNVIAAVKHGDLDNSLYGVWGEAQET